MNDPIAALEAVYSPGDDSDWLNGAIRAMAPALDRGDGVLGLIVDGTGAIPEPGRVLAVASHQVSDRALSMMQALNTSAATESARTRFRMAGPAGTLSGTLRETWDELALDLDCGPFADSTYLIAGDLAGVLCVMSAPLRRKRRLARHERYRLHLLAAHLAAALSLRHPARTERERPEALEALLAPDGTLHEARGDAAAAGARQSLKSATRARERARGPLRFSRAEAALEAWTPRVAARWSLVDRVERGGRRWVEAQVNPRCVPEPATLTPRECQVASLAAEGRSNKVIAYELGIAEATIATHLLRASAKLGARSRVELVRLLGSSSDAPQKPAPRELLEALTPAELDVAELVAQGKTNAEIARARQVALRTVGNQVSAVLKKLGAHSRAHLASLLLER